MQDQLNKTSAAEPLTIDTLKYGPPVGHLELRTLICGILQRTIMSGLHVTPENLVMSNGATAVLDNLFHLLGDAGSSCLLPAPCYPVFDNDLGSRNDVKTWQVYLERPDTDANVLDAAKRAAESARKPPRALLISNPDNPTGTIYSEERMKGFLKWCIRKKMHLVVDEIYALSVFPSASSARPFRSIIEIASEMAESLPPQQVEILWEHLHVVYALSKDFCMSGAELSPLAC
jgi:1-aminocyclopropane-1-carboxylate synthase